MSPHRVAQGTLSTFGTLVDHAAPTASGTASDRNVELVVPVPFA